MSDAEMIDAVCNLWQENCGDAEGFSWNYRAIYQELLRREQEAEDEEETRFA